MNKLTYFLADSIITIWSCAFMVLMILIMLVVLPIFAIGSFLDRENL